MNTVPLDTKARQVMIERAERRVARNWAHAVKHCGHPHFEEKFINQAIEAEAELNKLL